eukprot:TRINITY_DN10744_c0_g1_i1.p1 TRINITY_DN10744_c0_g1~~TRINITY_DN10744_c0_g1_i1.p1  ORF type:complete len:636 (+),score=81.99 TRINITY_DN10744_c0_g1_i1:94-2001(+)
MMSDNQKTLLNYAHQINLQQSYSEFRFPTSSNESQTIHTSSTNFPDSSKSSHSSSTMSKRQLLLNQCFKNTQTVVDKAQSLNILQNYFNDSSFNTGKETMIICSNPRLEQLSTNPTVLCFDRIQNLFTYNDSPSTIKSFDLVTVTLISQETFIPCGFLLCSSLQYSDYLAFFNAIEPILLPSTHIFGFRDNAFLLSLAEYWRQKILAVQIPTSTVIQPVHFGLFHFLEDNTEQLKDLFITYSSTRTLTEREDHLIQELIKELRTLYLHQYEWEFNSHLAQLFKGLKVFQSQYEQRVYSQFVSYFKQTWLPILNTWATFARRLQGIQHESPTENIRKTVSNMLELSRLQVDATNLEFVPYLIHTISNFVSEYNLLCAAMSSIEPTFQKSITILSSSSSTSTSNPSSFDLQDPRSGSTGSTQFSFNRSSSQDSTFDPPFFSSSSTSTSQIIFDRLPNRQDSDSNSPERIADDRGSHSPDAKTGDKRSRDDYEGVSSFLTSVPRKCSICATCGDAKVNIKCNNKMCQKCCAQTDLFCLLTAHAALRLQKFPSGFSTAIQEAMDKSQEIYLKYGDKKLIAVTPVKWVMTGFMFEDATVDDHPARKYRLDKISEVLTSLPKGTSLRRSKKKKTSPERGVK